MTEKEYMEECDKWVDDFNRIARRLGVEPTGEDVPINMAFVLKLLRAIEKVLDSQPCEDAVSRQELMKAFAELPHEYKNAEQRARTGGISACQVIVLKAPPVYPTRPNGRWIGYVRSNGTVYHCEKCGRKTVVKENFCPSCGYDMREGES